MNINIYPLSFHVLVSPSPLFLSGRVSLLPPSYHPLARYFPPISLPLAFPVTLLLALPPPPTSHIIVSERTRRLPDKVPIILLTARPLLVTRLQVRSLHVLRFTKPLVSLSSSRANFPLLRFAFYSLNQLLGNASSRRAFSRSLDNILREFRSSICFTPFAKHIS